MSRHYQLEDVLNLVAQEDTSDNEDIQELTPVISLEFEDMPAVNLPVYETVEVVTSTSTSATVGAADIEALTHNVGLTYESDNVNHSSNDGSRSAPSESETFTDVESQTSSDEQIQNNDANTSAAPSSLEENNTNPTRSRKRKRDPSSWIKAQRKRNRQSGSRYTNVRGQTVPNRRIQTKKDCVGKCRFKCAAKISITERENLFNSYWSLSDSEKNHFYNKTVERVVKKRQRATGQSRRQYSYAYYFSIDESRVRVCKEYYLSTLNISQRRVSYYFEVKHDSSSATPSQNDLRGKPTKDRIPASSKDFVRVHINSFPRVESHYCRASTSREYLERDLSLISMYRLYLEKCEQTPNMQPVKEHVYRTIFNTEFNLGFFSPKKDRCDKCEEFRVKEQFGLVDDDLQKNHENHVASKVATKTERDADRQSNTFVVCFDLENVISCPRANISSFFYRRKLSVYNLTAHCSLDSSAYCAIWNEKEAGRGANEIGSALIAILEKIEAEHQPKHIVLWSDSCVAQNKNSGITFALKDFMRHHDSVESIEQKYCEPGHSSIQEVDCIHSRIEKQLKSNDLFSPLGVMKCLKRSWCKGPMHIIQMKDSQFKKYMQSAKLLNLKGVPFTKVKSMKIEKNDLYSLTYKTSFTGYSTTVSIRPRSVGSRQKSNPTKHSVIEWPSTRGLTQKRELTKEKATDIKSMLKFMPPADKRFMSGLAS